MAKLRWFALRIASATTLLSKPGPQWLLAVCRPQKNAPVKRFNSNEHGISETVAYFEAKDKSFYKKGIEWLKKNWNKGITLQVYYVDE